MTFTRPSRRAAPLSSLMAALLLGACAHAPPPAPPAVLTPPPALKMSGVPPVPAELPARIGPYTEFKGATLLDWSPDGQHLLVAYRRGARVQLHTATGPGAPLQPVTHAAEPTTQGRFLPADGNIVVFERDAGGSEASRVYRLDLATGREDALTDAGARCDLGPFDAAGTWMLVRCAAVDRAAGGNAQRRGVTNELLRLDIKAGTSRVVATLPGTGWWPADVSPDGRSALLHLHRSTTDAEVWTVDLAGGERRKLLPRDGEHPAYFVPLGFAADGRRIFVATQRSSEFMQLNRYDPATHAFEPMTASVPWDVDGGALSRDRAWITATTNEAGRGVLRLFDARTLAPLPLPVPPSVNVRSAQPSPDGRRLAFAALSSSTPSEVHVVALDGPAGGAAVWAAADRAGVDTAGFQPTDVIAWPSFDGRTITGLITRPPARFGGRRPVLIDIHGGPEAQARIGFQGRDNYIVNELGIALVEPNVRGSRGFGKTFIALDDGRRREDSVKDIGALLDWIARQPDLDATRVAVTGGSYGGYMSLAVAARYPDRIRAAIDVVGISHFVTFLERTESYRRDLRRSEYGDERDPQMRAFLHSISPLTNAHRIRVPLFVIHGRNDPRVPVQEAEQIAATVANNGVPVWTLIAENEGHGFAKKENADYAFFARVLFLERFLLGR